MAAKSTSHSQRGRSDHSEYDRQGYQGTGFNSDNLNENNRPNPQLYYEQAYHGVGFNSDILNRNSRGRDYDRYDREHDHRHGHDGLFGLPLPPFFGPKFLEPRFEPGFYRGYGYGRPGVWLNFNFNHQSGNSPSQSEDAERDYKAEAHNDTRPYSQELRSYAEKYAHSKNPTDYKFGLLCHEALQLDDPQRYSQAVNLIKDVRHDKTGGVMGIGAHLDPALVDGLLATRFKPKEMYEFDRATRNGGLAEFIYKQNNELAAEQRAASAKAETSGAAKDSAPNAATSSISAENYTKDATQKELLAKTGDWFDGQSNDKSLAVNVKEYLKANGASEDKIQAAENILNKHQNDDFGFNKVNSVALTNAMNNNFTGQISKDQADKIADALVAALNDVDNKDNPNNNASVAAPDLAWAKGISQAAAKS